jgi:hypothetical protein
MAEKPEDQFTSDEKIAKGKELYGRGCRNYYVKSYSEAADDLSEACKFYAEAYGVDGDELGDVYLLYAKALVAVGQEENKLIEVPENEDEDEPVEEDDGEMEQDGEAAESNDASTPLADIPEDGKFFNAHLKKLNIYVHLSRLFISGLLITLNTLIMILSLFSHQQNNHRQKRQMDMRMAFLNRNRVPRAPHQQPKMAIQMTARKMRVRLRATMRVEIWRLLGKFFKTLHSYFSDRKIKDSLSFSMSTQKWQISRLKMETLKSPWTITTVHSQRTHAWMMTTEMSELLPKFTTKLDCVSQC